MRVTIKDIAKATGLATSTVSRSLNNSHLISKDTRERVQSVARDMGFHFNENARALISNRTNKIKLFVSKAFTHFSSEHFFRKLNETLIDELERYNMEIIITPSHSRQTGESNLYKGIGSGGVDAVIIAHSDLTREEYNYLKTSNLPVLFLYYRYPFFDKDDNYVGSDNYQGAYDAAEYLIQNGAYNLMALGIGDVALEFADRNRGYLDAIKDNRGNNLGIFDKDIEYNKSYEFIMENKELLKRCDGLFLESDHYFFGVKKGLDELGIKLGEDLMLIGYDNMEITRYIYEDYCSVDQNLDKLVTRGVEHLMKVIDKKQGKEKVINYTVKPRIVRGGIL